MGDQNDAIIGVATAMTSTSRVSRSEKVGSVIQLAILTVIYSEMDLEDFGWLCREIATGFPVLRNKLRWEIRQGWRRHRNYNEHL